jgi:hypothetical protein
LKYLNKINTWSLGHLSIQLAACGLWMTRQIGILLYLTLIFQDIPRLLIGNILLRNEHQLILFSMNIVVLWWYHGGIVAVL